MEKLKRGDRIKMYLAYLSLNSPISIKKFLNFAVENKIPEITSRRDVKLLESLNYIDLEMGLIKLNDSKEYEATRDEKHSANREEKAKIALTAVSMIKEKELFVGAGTTCEMFVKSINTPIKLLYTNGFEVARVANLNVNINRVVLIGGKLRPQSSAMCGPIANMVVETLKFSQSFITVTNMDAEFNLCNNNEDEAYLTNKVISRSGEVVCLMDHTKFNQNFYGNIISNVSSIDQLVIDKEIEGPEFEELKTKTNVKW
ncbi:DeoR family transcriptional regulator, aga operon transcriptional repressor [Spiroplasma chinense]|uniref:DeoR family transcriptional regulator, aga operon transcriptional repressor n=1 Tax=Spiroplasma chinense TaxID=216932 RepID=A0A5B9Y462_9MOLU|nr:DeoR/GlpR family DNA-binding transcription regulator [Spiroplasma chinense]QEH61469.1 DeoR family transcriptional regulator, aga operon transcriptional repressor [Spiroplasma chinense]